MPGALNKSVPIIPLSMVPGRKDDPMNPLLKRSSTFLGILAFLVLVGFSIGSSRVAPEYALVFIDASQNAYIAPPCLTREKWVLYPKISIE